MDLSNVEKVADAVLYEGYMLYPYRATSVKNRQRFNWGALVPRSYSEEHKGTEKWEMRTECLAQADSDPTLTVRARFLQLCDRKIGRVNEPSRILTTDLEWVPSLDVAGELYQEWQEAIEQHVDLPPVALAPGNGSEIDFSFPESRDVEGIKDGEGMFVGAVTRTRNAISGNVTIRLEQLSDDVFKTIVTIRNTTEMGDADGLSRDDALLSSLVSTHTILGIDGGEFISLLDPPERYRDLVSTCESFGTYPVLAGQEGANECVLSSPIILYDHPQIAPESAGELFDGTEIDEILTLRIMTLTDEEKREMRAVDDRARQILERTEMLPQEHLLKMHGALRDLKRSKRAANG